MAYKCKRCNKKAYRVADLKCASCNYSLPSSDITTISVSSDYSSSSSSDYSSSFSSDYSSSFSSDYSSSSSSDCGSSDCGSSSCD